MRQLRCTSLIILVLMTGLCVAAQTESQVKKMSRPKAMHWLLSSYEPSVEAAYSQILSNLPKDTRDDLQSAKLDLLPDETPFSFYRDASDNQLVHVCLGGLNNLDISATAFAISAVDLKDPAWWFDYLLYHRRLGHTNPRAVWVDPLVAAGLTKSNTPEPVARQMAIASKGIIDDMVIFVVGHELGHLALHHDGAQKQGESQTDYFNRLRDQELKADRFSLEKTVTLNVSPLAVSASLLTHLIVYGTDRDDTGDPKHPDDNARLQQVVDFYSSQKDPRYSDFLQIMEPLVETLRGRDGISAFQVLDMESEGVSLKSLRKTARSHNQLANARPASPK